MNNTFENYQIINNKVVHDDKIAILISPDYGLGWSTLCRIKESKEKMIFDTDIISILLSDSINLNILKILIQKKYPNIYVYDIEQLTVKWIPKGSIFIIDEYDGYESIKYYNEDDWIHI